MCISAGPASASACLLYIAHVELYKHICIKPNIASRTSRTPVLFVFGRSSVDVGTCAAYLRECISADPAPWVVITDAIYTHAIGITYDCMLFCIFLTRVGELAVQFADMPRVIFSYLALEAELVQLPVCRLLICNMALNITS